MSVGAKSDQKAAHRTGMRVECNPYNLGRDEAHRCFTCDGTGDAGVDGARRQHMRRLADIKARKDDTPRYMRILGALFGDG